MLEDTLVKLKYFGYGKTPHKGPVTGIYSVMGHGTGKLKKLGTCNMNASELHRCLHATSKCHSKGDLLWKLKHRNFYVLSSITRNRSITEYFTLSVRTIE